LIFAEKSPRYVNLTTAEAITEAVSANFVGVFVNADVATVVEYAKRCSLAAVQLHGDEDQEYIDALRQALPATCAIWLALGISESIPKYDYRQVDLLLCDCQSGSAKGGTGQIFDWDLLATINTDTPIGLAGGLEPDNITEALAQNVALLDVNSGVERTPGEKCEARVTQLFANLRRY